MICYEPHFSFIIDLVFLQTVKNTMDPVFKERFLFSLEPRDLQKRVLTLQVDYSHFKVFFCFFLM